jgi:hypothetical protein
MKGRAMEAKGESSPASEPKGTMTSIEPIIVPVKVARRSGEGAERKVDWDDENVLIFPLLTAEQFFGILGRLLPVFCHIQDETTFWALLAAHPEQFYAAVGIAVDLPVERVAAMAPVSFMSVVFTLVETHKETYQEMIAQMGKWMAVPVPALKRTGDTHG